MKLLYILLRVLFFYLLFKFLFKTILYSMLSIKKKNNQPQKDNIIDAEFKEI